MSDAADATVWRRDPRWVHRLVPDHAILAAPGGEERTLGGLALGVWVVLDEPGTAGQVVDRMRDLWPEAAAEAGADAAAIADAVVLLHDRGVVEPAGPGASPGHGPEPPMALRPDRATTGGAGPGPGDAGRAVVGEKPAAGAPTDRGGGSNGDADGGAGAGAGAGGRGREPGDSPSADELLRAVAVHGLPGAPELQDLSSEAWAGLDPLALVSLAESERLLGALQFAVASGALALPATAAGVLAERQAATMAWCLKLEVRLLELREWFAEAGGVRHRVIKGPAVAHLDEADPSLRSFADLDVLVAAEHVDRAVAVLERHGARRPWPERRPGFDRRFAKSVTMTCPDGIEVDLHRTLCDGVYGVRIPLGDLFEAPDRFHLGGTTVPALSRPHRLVHAAYHAVLGSPAPRLHSLRDIARYLASADLTPEAVRPVARRWRGEAVLTTAVAAALDALPFAAPAWEEWRTEIRVDPREKELVGRSRAEGSSLGPAKLDMWRELPGLRRKALYAAAVLWPTRAHLEARGRTRWSNWRGASHRDG